MKNRFLTCILLFGLFIITLQSAPNKKKKYFMCLQTSGTTCGASACLSTFQTWSSADPCTLYNYYYLEGTPPVRVKAQCCSGLATAIPTNLPQGRFLFYGAPVYVSLDTFQLVAHCAENDEEVVIGDFTNLIPTEWPTVVLNCHVQGTDTFVIEAYQPDTVSPYYKASSKITIKYGSNVVDGVCSGPTPFNKSGLDFIMSAKVTTSFFPNPLTGDQLQYEVLNPLALNENLKFNFYNVLGELIYTFTPKDAKGVIDMKKIPNGPLLIAMISDSSKEEQTIIINR